MNKFFRICVFPAILFLMACGCKKDKGPDESDSKMQDPDVIAVFEVDTETNLKNPYMGWTLYSTFADIPKAYWARVDEAAEKYAGALYIRWTWADMEPEEGRYAWEYNDKFKEYVQGAIDRDLRLCFRVYIDSYAQGKNATPEWVLEKAQSYTTDAQYFTPYGDDPYFLEKYTKFIRAFGERFNDPSYVDYVDSYGLGYSGEENNIRWLNPGKSLEAHNTIVKAYEEAFDKVINVINFGVRNDAEEAVVYDELGFSSRRDGYCSHWFTDSDQLRFSGLFPGQILVAEACYSAATDFSNTENAKWADWTDYSRDLIDLALKTHTNYLDLRDATTTARWLDNNPDGVKLYHEKCGYRIYPSEIRYKQEGNSLVVQHSWLNHGIGVLPNNNIHIRYKYRVALGLFDADGNLTSKLLSDGIEVSDLVNGKEIMATDELDLSGIASGKYRLGVAVINTLENDSKDIRLAVRNARLITGEWIYVGDVDIK